VTRQPAAPTPGRSQRAQLAATLVTIGALRSARWISAFQAVPRHVFVPRIYADRDHNGTYEPFDSANPAQRTEWLSLVYADEPLVTKLDGEVWLSSSSQPSLMAEMLEALAVTGTERVLEIGTGTGYNAALLSEGLGSAQVVSIDIDTQFITAAQDRLHSLGYTPTVATADAADGYPAAAPYDRIIATCSLPHIPPAWIRQATTGGLIMANLHRDLGGGALALLTVADYTATGHFLPFFGGFMPTRTQPHFSTVDLLEGVTDRGTPRTAQVPADALDDDAFMMFAALRLPGVHRTGLLPDGGPEQSWLLAHDGSWACRSLPDGPVSQGGRRRLWDRLEDIYQDWAQLGRPRREEFGITVTCRGDHVLWHHAPDGQAWAL
jgi:protein-L-isoaspartate(D-aspartate) O-methyltransferase